MMDDAEREMQSFVDFPEEHRVKFHGAERVGLGLLGCVAQE